MSDDKQMTIGLVVPAVPQPKPQSLRSSPAATSGSGYPGGGRIPWLSDRRAARQEADIERKIDEARTRESMREEPAPSSMLDVVQEIDAAPVKTLVETLSKLVGRPMQVVTVNKLRKGETSHVVQRCRACCAEIRSEVDHDWLTTLPHAIRNDYDSHRCDVEGLTKQLHGCSVVELDQLHADAENELQRVSQRLVDIERHLGQRKADGTKDDGR